MRYDILERGGGGILRVDVYGSTVEGSAVGHYAVAYLVGCHCLAIAVRNVLHMPAAGINEHPPVVAHAYRSALAVGWIVALAGCIGKGEAEAVEHGPEWKAAEEAIFQKYNEILNAKIPDEPVEVTVTPHKVGDGGILAMPLKANIPDPQRDDWKLVTCPICGAECWENDLARQAMAAEPELRAACTTCALKAGVTAGGKH